MGGKGLKILLIDDGRQVLPFLRSLKKAGHYIEIACSSRISCGFLSRYPDKRLIWPDYFQKFQEFTEKLLEYVARNKPDITLTVGDVGVKIIAENRKLLTQWTAVTVPELEIVNRAADKLLTMQYCMSNGILCPQTYPLDETNFETNLSKLIFPVMVKPRRGIGAIGLHRFERPEPLIRNFNYLQKRYGPLLVQEFIPLEGGTQFQAEAFLDANSKMKVCMVIAKPRFFPVTGGTSTANVTIDRPDIQEYVRKLLEGIKWVGAADVDLILDPRDGVPKILEINPRVTAGIKIGFVAGIDYADLHVKLATGKEIPVIDNYKLGVYSRNLCMDIMWYLFASRKQRSETQPSFFNFFGRNVCYQTLAADDILPFFGFALSMARKYMKPTVWRSKLGKDLQQN